MYRIKHQDIRFKTKRIKTTGTQNKNQEVRREPDPTNPEDLLDYIQPFTHLFNKKKFGKLMKQQEWDYEINLMEEASKELNVK